MPGLFTDIVSENIRTPNDGCGMVRILHTMSDQDRADVEKALADPTIAASAIDRALRKNGHQTSGNMVRRHRRGDCACGHSR